MTDLVEIERIGWNEALHPRSGGKFAPKGSATQGKSATQGGRARAGHAHDSSEGLSYNGRTGAGYGKKGGDGRVHGLQAELNRLGFKDGSGKSLKLDGKLGPRTTAAIKKAQKALGLKADGIATPGLLAKLKGSKGKTTHTRTPKKAVKMTPSKGHPMHAAKKTAPARTAKRPTFTKQTNTPPSASAKKAAYRKNVSAP